MRALFCVADEPGAVKRRRSRDAVGKTRRGGERKGAAHAIAVHPDRAGLGRTLRVGKGDHRRDVVHDRRDRHLGAHPSHPLALGAALLEHVGPKNRIAAGAMVEIGQQHVIADRRQPTRHVAQFLADARRVHQQQYRRIRAAAFRVVDEGFHLPRPWWRCPRSVRSSAFLKKIYLPQKARKTGSRAQAITAPLLVSQSPGAGEWLEKFCALNDNRAADDRRKLLAFARDLLNSDYAGHRLSLVQFAPAPHFNHLNAVYNAFDFSGPLEFVKKAAGLSDSGRRRGGLNAAAAHAFIVRG